MQSANRRKAAAAALRVLLFPRVSDYRLAEAMNELLSNCGAPQRPSMVVDGKRGR